MPSNKDYYETLGLPRTASEAEIKRAFRKLAKEHHPDATGKLDARSEERFKEISAAYEVLSDPKKRQAYDQFGAAGANGAPGFDPSQFGGGFGGGFDFGGGAGGFGDIFETFFGGGAASPRRPDRGEDLTAEIMLSFEEGVRGATKEIAYERIAPCPTCGGDGAEPGSKLKQCETCGGSGQVRRQQRTILGSIMTARACPTCGGTGQVPEKPCHTCGGSGTRTVSERLKVKIPAGIDDGEMVRLTGKGNAAHGVPPGDLYVRVRVRPSREFRREGNDIHSEAVISVPQAVLGDEIEVPTVQGKVMVKVPAGTLSGTVLRLRGKGIAREGGEAGYHLLTVTVDIPKKLSRKERELYEELRKQA